LFFSNINESTTEYTNANGITIGSFFLSTKILPIDKMFMISIFYLINNLFNFLNNIN
jgi:hypothetical protein